MKALPVVDAPRLRYLKLGNNLIETCESFRGHQTLQVIVFYQILDLNHNKLTRPTGLQNMPNLTSLDLSHNPLTTLEGLSQVDKLSSLNLTATKALETLSGISLMPSLESLNLFEGGLKSIKDIELLLPFTNLKFLNVNATPLEADTADAKQEAVMILLRKFFWCKGAGEEEEKEEITEDDLIQARETLKERERIRLEEEENERLRKEEEERERLQRLQEQQAAGQDGQDAQDLSVGDPDDN